MRRPADCIALANKQTKAKSNAAARTAGIAALPRTRARRLGTRDVQDWLSAPRITVHTCSGRATSKSDASTQFMARVHIKAGTVDSEPELGEPSATRAPKGLK